MICASAPERLRYTTARLRVSQASGARRLLVIEAIQHLLPRASAGEAEQLRALQASGSELVRRSSAHVGKWTADVIASDWPGYCAASRAMQVAMRARLETERRVLYPLLERRSAG